MTSYIQASSYICGRQAQNLSKISRKQTNDFWYLPALRCCTAISFKVAISVIALAIINNLFNNTQFCYQSESQLNESVDMLSVFYKNHELFFIMSLNQFKGDQKQQILQSFILFDRDNDGKLTRKVVNLQIKEITGLSSQAEIYKLLSQVDSNKNGFIQRDEFLTLMARMMMTIPTQKDMQQSFKIFDKKGQKGITFSGLKQALNSVGVCCPDQEIQQIVAELDEDGDGKITYDEFKKLMNRSLY